MGRRGVSGRVVDGRGRAGTTRISSNDLIGILFEGDLDPVLRSEFPAAVRSAVRGDTALLARLVRRAEGETEGSEENLSEGFDSPLYFSTICDETDFPWKRAGSPKARLREALTALRAAPAKAFAPFTPANALALSDVPVCADWPVTPGGPEVDETPLPNVPTLILSGADDLRTPTANAREVAAQIPDAQLVVVPNTGHSVLGSDPTSCAHNALKALFSGKTVKQCGQSRPPQLLLPTPLAPRSLGEVPSAHGTHGRVGRTVGATLLTLRDFGREVVLAALEQAGGTLFGGPPSVSVGGLRAGWGALAHAHLVLHGYSYVPGVTVTGRSLERWLYAADRGLEGVARHDQGRRAWNADGCPRRTPPAPRDSHVGWPRIAGTEARRGSASAHAVMGWRDAAHGPAWP